MNMLKKEYYNYLYPNSEKLMEKLKKEMEKKDKITFARYMETVIYDKEYGYYHNSEINPYEDYHTSPKVHPVFGKLLAKKLSLLWKNMGSPAIFQIIEPGPGDGLLCRQILEYVKNSCPDFYKNLHYIFLCNRPVNSPFLSEFKDKVSQVIYKDFKIPLKNIEGCFISNEVPDSFPFHLVKMIDNKLKEIFITMENNELKEVEGELSSEEINKYLENINITFPEGNRGEVNLMALKWIKELAHTIKRGYIITIDYGYESEELYSQKRKEGTLLCYHNHTFHSNPYKRPGYDDITGHINFTALIKEGEKSGLTLIDYCTQRDFLINLGIKDEIKKLDRNNMNLMDYNRQVKAMKRLVDMRGLGNIKVLIQKSEVL